MKRYILILALALVASPSEARKGSGPSPYRHEISISWSGLSPFGLASFESSTSSSVYDEGLDFIYSNYISRRVTTGMISADWNVQLKKWLSLGAQFNIVANRSTQKSPLTNAVTEKFSDYSLSLLPYARLTWLNREYVKMYTAFGLGISYNHDGVPDDHYTYPDNYVIPRFQIVPFGVTAGRRVYTLLEVGLGTEYLLGRIGIGYRF